MVGNVKESLLSFNVPVNRCPIIMPVVRNWTMTGLGFHVFSTKKGYPLVSGK